MQNVVKREMYGLSLDIRRVCLWGEFIRLPFTSFASYASFNAVSVSLPVNFYAAFTERSVNRDTVGEQVAPRVSK